MAKSKYYELLYTFSLEWVKKRMTTFTIEDMKLAFYGAGNAPPDNSSIFGKLLQSLSQNKLIFEHSFVKVKRPNGKPRVVSVWISLEYSLKQQKNAKGDKESLTLNFDE